MKISFEDKCIKESFEPITNDMDRSFLDDSRRIERIASIENHKFFSVAKDNKDALKLWLSQEALVTNPFSQILFNLIGSIRNVHVRSILIPVVFGEHSVITNGIAHNSHPWLLHSLCCSLDIDVLDIKPTNALIKFVDFLENSIQNQMYGLGALGVGNELLLLEEYGAIIKCFDNLFADIDYMSFLQANIVEDAIHSKLMGDAAIAMVGLGYSRDDFLAGAKDGVQARIIYYDELLKVANRYQYT